MAWNSIGDDGLGHEPVEAARRTSISGDGAISLLPIGNGCGHVLTAPKVVVDGATRPEREPRRFNIRWDEAADTIACSEYARACRPMNGSSPSKPSAGGESIRRTNVNLDGDERPRNLLRQPNSRAAHCTRPPSLSGSVAEGI